VGTAKSHLSEARPGLSPTGSCLSHVPPGILSGSALSIVVGIGLLVVGVADNAARHGRASAEPLFWLGLVTIFAPIAAQLLRREARRQDRIVAVVLLGMALYAVKLLLSPNGFTFGDELIRLRTMNDIARSLHLFHPNPINDISARYPGSEIMTEALAKLSGLSSFHAGIVIVGAARLVAVLAVFLIVERVADSARAGGIAVLIYAANPNFLFEGAQFSYESVGLPLALLAILAVAGPRDDAGESSRLPLAAALATAAAVVTHHVASYALAVFLVAWALTGGLIRRRRGEVRQPGSVALALVALFLAAAWLAGVAPATVQYLTSSPTHGVVQLFDWAIGRGHARTLFGSRAGGYSSPPAERAAAIAAVVLLLLALPLGLRAVWRRERHNAAAVVLTLVALLYPVSLALRLTPAGQEAANRASEYVFLALGFVIALWVLTARARASRSAAWIWRFAGVATLTLIFCGGADVGWSHTARLPGSYLPGAGPRSYDPQGVLAARWLLEKFGPGHSIAADGTQAIIMGSLGDQRPMGVGGGGTEVWPLYFSEAFGRVQYDLLRRDRIEFLVVDRRLGHGYPADGRYISTGEPDERLLPSELAKFDRIPGLSCIYDSGDIKIYRVSRSLMRSPAGGRRS